MARRHDTIGVLAANNQSLAGIERVIIGTNPKATMLGYANLRLVEDVEHGIPPERIVRTHRIDSVLRAFAASGCTAIIAGCTHFPYFVPWLTQSRKYEIVDPAAFIVASITGRYTCPTERV